MATIINARSPFFIKVSDSNLQEATLQLYIYEGVKDTTPDAADLKYTITKSEIEENDYIVFEIGELVRDYLDIQYDGTYTSYSVWVNAVVTAINETGGTITSPTITPSNANQFVALEGYGYFEEGMNPEESRGLLQSNLIQYAPSGEDFIIPVFAEDTNTVKFYQDTTLRHTVTITDNDNTNQKIQYVDSSVVTGTFNKAVVNYDSGGGTADATINFYELDCSRYDPIKVAFVNKFGALQEMWFDKKSIESINTKSQQYKASVVDFSNFTYNTNAHQMRTLSLIGNESIVMNTGYIDESQNDLIRELMLSEQVWMTEPTGDQNVLPLKPKTQSVQYKTRVNDRLVNYTIEFDMAFDKINNIR